MTFQQTFDEFVQSVLAPGAAAYLAARVGHFASILRNADHVLDVGCGNRSPLISSGIAAIGVDIDAARVRAYGTNAVVADAGALPFGDGSAAAVFSFGLLHHLDDVKARCAIAEMVRVARAGGLIAIFDGVFPKNPWRRPLATLIRIGDRGHHMRGEAALVGLFDRAAGWHFEQVHYSATGLEGVWCVRSG